LTSATAQTSSEARDYYSNLYRERGVIVQPIASPDSVDLSIPANTPGTFEVYINCQSVGSVQIFEDSNGEIKAVGIGFMQAN
jgi:hypothetical protein